MTVCDRYSNCSKSREPFEDKEWEEAEASNENPAYFWLEMSYGGRCVKLYKPAVARLVSKRTGQKVYPVERNN